ncbi:MAG: two-component system, OmpR family, response regulator [Myxococcales bacterium]|jgi:DNA-binding response OmpR family regulator|nr:two-component system, OmpR family, response regulator [Myxococcales bacterium]
MTVQLRVLIVEGDQPLALQTSRYLVHHGLAAHWCGDGQSAMSALRDQTWDVVLLDLTLPDSDGLAVCQRIRLRWHLPIIAVSRACADAEKVAALEAGADDHLTIPFSFPELLARVRAVARRARGNVVPAGQTVQVGPLLLEAAALRVTLDARPVAVTSYEFALLWALAQAAGKVITRDRLLELTRDNSDEVFDRSIDVNISRLRQKLGDDPRQPRLIKTVRGEGYLLADEGRGPRKL